MKIKIEELMEKASRGYKPPFRYDMSGGIVWSSEETWSLSAEIKGLVVRGWGALTGTGGGKGLSEQEAAEIQDAFAEYAAHALNNFEPMLKALIRCKDAFINDDWEGPLKNQIIEAIEAASTVEVTK